MPMSQFLTDSVVMTILYFAAALACTFMGYQLQKPLIALTVLYAGFVLCYRVGGQFLPYPEAVTGVAIVAAVIAAALSYHLYLAGIFVALVIVSLSVCRAWISEPWIALLAGIVIGCALGFLAVQMNRPIVILVTGGIGGFAAANYGEELLRALIPLNPLPDGVLVVCGIILSAAGYVTQIGTTQKTANQL